MKTTTPFILFFLFTLAVSAQTKEDVRKIQAASNMAELNRLVPYYDSIFRVQKEAALKMAKIKGWKTIIKTKNGGIKELVRVNQYGNPVYYTTENTGAALTTRANRLNTGGSLGLSLDGQNMTIGEWDGGKVRNTHTILTGRVTQVDNASTLSAHSTHVAGTMIGSAAGNAQAKGMASQATLKAYDWNSDVSEATAAAANGLLVSNHSYGADSDFVSIPEWGKYDAEARYFDNVMFNAPYYQFVNSAGNSRNGGYNPDKDGYDLLSGKSNSKNGIIVAAVNQVSNYVNASSVNMSSFSSWGPTDDGRIKPDICGKGVNLRSSVSSSDNAYSLMSGTSMSSPNVAGTLLLLQQHYKNVKGNFMRAATLRGLAIHTADEAGTDPGPDYRFGWGLLNAEKAANLISKEGAETYIQENILLDGKSYSFNITPANTSQPIVATICWTDPAGQIVTSSQIDLSTPALVNDLDIRITKNAETEVNFPWKLNPYEVNDPATRGDNVVDNVEKIELANPSGTYTVTVSHKGTLANARQHYSLIISGINVNQMLLSSDESLIKRNCVGTSETTFNYQMAIPATFAETATFSMEGLPAGATATFTPGDLSAAGSGSVSITGLTGTPIGTYPLLLKADSAGYHGELTLTLVVQNTLIDGPTLTSPANNTNPADTALTLTWENIGANAASYTVEISKDNTFTTNVHTYTALTNQIDLTDLDFGSNYYWRVKSNNVCGASAYSAVFSFTTQCSDATEIDITAITIEGATATWSNPNGSDTFEVAVVPNGASPSGAFITIHTNSYTFTSLNSYTDYDVYVRSSCSNGTFSALANTAFETLVNHCVDGIFYDSGGPTANYSNGENKITTIYPIHPGEMASVTFNTFELENQIDRLTIYNGPNTTYPFIVEEYGFTGTNNPGTITSTDPSGTLTFRFYSDGATTAAGWNATVSCAMLGTPNFGKPKLNCYPNPANTSVNISSPESIKSVSVYTMLGQLIKIQKPDAKETVVNIAALSAGQYLFKVETTSSVDTIKILKRN